MITEALIGRILLQAPAGSWAGSKQAFSGRGGKASLYVGGSFSSSAFKAVTIVAKARKQKNDFIDNGEQTILFLLPPSDC